ncbi:hypothetical protein HJFPF1_02623 [Paramyrothecium foliicola]|nr:hypothetical protein HJFPF1_02623 [Paramyrothecium foliicola]
MADEYKRSGPSAIDRILSFLQFLALSGILVVLAMLLVELKALTNEDKGLVINTVRGTVDFALTSSSSARTGASPSSPIYVESTGRGTSNMPFFVESVGRGSANQPVFVRMDN